MSIPLAQYDTGRACPTLETLAQFFADELPVATCLSTTTHLETCPRCQGILDRLSSAPEDLQANLRASRSQSRTENDRAALVELCEHLYQLDPEVRSRSFGWSASMPLLGPPERPGELGMLGAYPVLRLLGRGGMGVVYLARHPALNRQVAIKVLPLERAGAAARERFLREAQALAAIEHEHVVRIHEVHLPADGLAYLVMEYIEGPTLLEKIRAEKRLAPMLAAEICRQIALGLAAVHARGLIHRDVKPGNILIETSTGRARIVDFGLVRVMDAANDLTREDLVGSPDYMSPEQVLGSSNVDSGTDLYSLGVTLYQAITGETPFRGTTAAVLGQIQQDDPEPPRKKNEAIPRDLETICMRCLEKERGKRYASAAALAEDLRRFVHHEPILARPVSAVEHVIRWAWRQPLVAGLSAAVIALFLLSFTSVTWLWIESVDRGQKLADALGKEKQARQVQQETAYFDRIAAARLAFDGNNVREAAVLLDDCPAELRDWEWKYLHRKCRGAPSVQWFDERSRSQIVFRPDGKAYATSGADEVRVHETSSGKLLWRWNEGAIATSRLAWDAHGKWLAASTGEKVQLLHPTTGALQAELVGHHAGVDGLAACPTGQLLASAAANGEVLIWNGNEARKLHLLKGHTARISSLAFHPAGGLLASSSHDKTIKIWDVAKGEMIRTLHTHKDPVAAMVWSPCGKFIVSASGVMDIRLGDEGLIQVLDAATGAPVSSTSYPTGHVSRLTFRPDGGQLAAVCTTGARRWTWPELKELPPILLPHDLAHVAYTPDSTQLVTLEYKGAVKYWECDAGQEPVDVRPSNRTSIVCLMPHPTQQLIACGNGRGALEVIDLDTRKSVGAWHVDPTDMILSLAWSADGRSLAAGTREKQILVCQLSVPEARVILGHEHRVYGITFTPDNKQIVTASADKTVRIWDVATGKELRRLPGAKRVLRALAFNPRAGLVAASEDHASIRMWNLNSGELNGTFQTNPPDDVTCLAFSPDGKLLAAGGPTTSSFVHILNADTCAPMAQCRGHKHKVTSVAWSPDGKRLVSSSDDSTIRLWEPRSGRLLLTLQGHKGGTNSVAFSADGKLVISAGWDGKVRVWDGTPFTASH